MFKLTLKILSIHSITEDTSVAACQLDSSITIQDAALLIANNENINQVISITGEEGSGRTTYAQGLVYELICSGFINQLDILYIEIGQYDSDDSLWNCAIEVANKRGDREMVALLASNLTKKEVKLNAVVNLWNSFKVICFDNMRAKDNHSCYQTILTLIKNLNTTIVCVSDALSEDATLSVKIYGLLPNIVRDMGYTGMSHEENIVKQSYKRLQYNPVATRLYIQSSLEFGAFEVPELANHESPVSKVLGIIWQFLSQIEKDILGQLSELRQPLPVTADHIIQVRLIRMGLVKQETVRSGRLLFSMISLSNCIQHFLHAKRLVNFTKNTQSSHQFDVLDSWMALLSLELQHLVEDAKNNAWPFVPEKWQYVTDAGAKESYNVKDLLTQKNKYFLHLTQYDILQECLHHSIVRKDIENMAAIIFVLDRFIYWQGGSAMLLSIVDTIRKGNPLLPIAPQLIIRKARILRTSGDLQGAEKVLDTILNEKQKLGGWQYKETHDHHLVKAVCIQIKGEIQAGLGQWLTAATYLLDSINLFKTLPKVDKKGLSCSLSLLVNALQNMSSNDYKDIAKQYSLTSPHPYLQAYDCAWEAANLAMFTPLFYARHKRRAGEMMLEYAKLTSADDQSQYLHKALEELKESLQAHKSLGSLNSREQYYEFIAAVYKTSWVYELFKERDMAKDLKNSAMLLYQHYCRHPTSIIHDSFSQHYINVALTTIQLPKLSKEEGTFGTMITAPNFTQGIMTSSNDNLQQSSDSTVDRCATTLQTVSISNQPTVDRFKTTVLTINNQDGSNENEPLIDDDGLLNSGNISVHECVSSRYDAVHTSWRTQKTLVYIGEQLNLKKGKKGAQRDPFMVEYLNQDEPLGKYVGKKYKKFQGAEQYEEDVRCQMTARFYVGLFNKELYDKDIEISHIQFLPVVMLQLLDTNGEKTADMYNIEPYIHGDFTKITNNWMFVNKEGQGSKLVLAFSHYTHERSNETMIIVDHQGWTSSDHLSTTFLTDPQIHSIDRELYGTGNLGEDGIATFWRVMHPECNEICKQLGLERPANR